MAAAAPLLLGLGAGGLGAAALVGGGAAALAGLARYILIPPEAPVPKPAPSEPPAPAGSGGGAAASRWKTFTDALKQAVKAKLPQDLADLISKSIDAAVDVGKGALGIWMLADAVNYWVINDLIVRSTFHPDLHIPTKESFVRALDSALTSAASLLVVDLVTDRDVGSDIAESIMDSFNEAVIGDIIKAYLDTVTGTEAVDDDEIRDVVGEGALAEPEELAYLGARSGLDTFSAMAELYTGLLQGDNSYFSRAASKADDYLSAVEEAYGAAAMQARLLRKIGQDVSDSIYWYMGIMDWIEAEIKAILRDAYTLYYEYTQRVIDEVGFNTWADSALTRLGIINTILDGVYAQAADLFNNHIWPRFGEFLVNTSPEAVFKAIDMLADDVGRRMAEYKNVVKHAYQNMKVIRSVSVS